jgi:hypothetical protein
LAFPSTKEARPQDDCVSCRHIRSLSLAYACPHSTLVEGDYTQDHQVFLKENGIEHRRILILANKDPTVRTPDHVVNRVLEIILNKANHPLLLHCNKGKVRAKADNPNST